MPERQAVAVSDRMTYFFDSGVRFTCRQCGQCCTGDSGTVYVSGPEIKAIAEFLHCSVQELCARALYPFKDSYSIQEDSDGSCLFYRGGCSIYPVRPAQCRSYPFWTKAMRSAYAWKQTARECPGIGCGRLYSRDEILDVLEWSPV
ncbi:YkgJ family cysteine cluster protein [Desulfovermiculus halophilus]|jgi:hypothetical protein|uniref:YkgJ family cysteine cluster protein n=1 Tax=Desulfovermiculus halophilus TaxID=339722 RepID=UPI000B2EFD18|nr:YkgJ family cysteine cluster protein [Desulfovermiculus halophilus]